MDVSDNKLFSAEEIADLKELGKIPNDVVEVPKELEEDAIEALEGKKSVTIEEGPRAPNSHKKLAQWSKRMRQKLERKKKNKIAKASRKKNRRKK